MDQVASKKTIFLIAGESGSGKDSLVNKLCEETGLQQLISYSTRPRREDEGNTHIFISKDEIEQYKDSMIAYTQIGEFEYFSTIQQLDTSDIYIVDPKGIDYLKSKIMLSNYYNSLYRFVVIYINTPFYIRYDRAINIRKDDCSTFIKRVRAEENQFNNFKAANGFDYAIQNIDFDKAYEVLKHIIEIESKS